MKKSTVMQQIKEELKQLAKYIRTHKNLSKEATRCFSKIGGDSYSYLKEYDECWKPVIEFRKENNIRYDVSSEFRHKHIAYCLVRGRTMEEIERYNHPGNEPNEKLVNQFKRALEDKLLIEKHENESE